MAKKTSSVADFVGVEEAAKLLKLAPRLIRYHAKKKNLTGEQFGRVWIFRRKDVLAFTPPPAGRRWPLKKGKKGGAAT